MSITTENVLQRLQREASTFKRLRPVTLAAVGKWRCYFNRHNAAGMPWCVSPDDGSFEICVSEVKFTAPTSTVHRPKATPDDEDGRLSAWIACSGLLEVFADGTAMVSAP